MLTKETLAAKFSKEWKKQYEVELFRQKGFVRKRCVCGRHFWTLDPNRKLCGDTSCEDYGFIGRPITKVRWDYIQAWKEFERFFVKNGHTSIKRYPVVDRWRPDLYFTIASIQDFQRIDSGKMVFEYPADPLIVPQVCLRFPDIPNVGVTGRHHTSFIMPGQHAFGSYWKDRCLELNFNFLNKVMGIPEQELVYIEDVWAMGDFSAFGPSIETLSKGCELVNSVFMQYTGTGRGLKELDQKVIDVGWGHERLVWFSAGTPTTYDAVFGPVIDWMKKKTGLVQDDLFYRYAMLSGKLNIDEIQNLSAAKLDIARKLGIDAQSLRALIEPLQALYAIADHTKTLLFAVTDGAIPSNVGGGYNLRVLLRRSLSFIKEFGFELDLMDIAERHARHLKPLSPELKDGLGPLARILEVEQARYQKTLERAAILVEKELRKGQISEDRLLKLYTSNGVTPELVEKIAKKQGAPFSIPDDFYARLTSPHTSGEKEYERELLNLNVTGIPPTRKLFYEKPTATEFKAKVLKRRGDWIVLDQTLFYPTGGGQPSDLGWMRVGDKKFQVKDVQKIGDVIVHKVSGPKPGQTVIGEIDWERRFRLMQMHTCTHIVAGAARKVLGRHIWQAGAKKGLKSSRIDLTHFKPFTQEEIKKIEDLANRTVKKAIPVEIQLMPRGKAEERYGFVLYQGGASPGKVVRVVRIGNLDVEACGGTHLASTKDVERVKIIRAERIQDGVNRLEFTCSKAAAKFEQEQKRTFFSAYKMLRELPLSEDTLSRFGKQGFDEGQLKEAARIFSVEPNQLPRTLQKFCQDILKSHGYVNELRESASKPQYKLEEEPGFEAIERAKSLPAACQAVFDFWKSLKKTAEGLRKTAADLRARELLQKAKAGRLFDIIHGSRADLIETATQLLVLNPELTVILANEAGDVVGMSKTRNMAAIVQNLCKRAGGSGGGRKDFAQGHAELSKLVKLMHSGKIKI